MCFLRQITRVATALVLACAISGQVVAHHSFTTKFDSKKKITLSGTIGSVRYSNPHIFFTLETANDSWSIETEGISVAKAKGLTGTHLKTGAKATVTGWPSRSGSAELGLSAISFPGGPSISMRGTAR
jgi:hypothetical protein